MKNSSSDNQRVTIGIDIGATKIVVGAVDGTAIHRQQRILLRDFPTPETCRVAMIDAIKVAASDATIDKVGIGCPGPTDFELGVLLNFFTMPAYFGWNLISDLEAAFGVPIVMINDVQAALLGEIALEPGLNAESIALLSVGTGVGAAFCYNGTLLEGRGWAQPEISQIPVSANEKTRVLEDFLSGKFVETQAVQGGYGHAAAIAEAARQGDAKALTLLEPFFDSAAWAVSVVVHMYSPQVVLLSGTALHSLFPLVERRIQQRLASAFCVAGCISSTRSTHKKRPDLPITAWVLLALPVAA